jgi:hypothetical protein
VRASLCAKLFANGSLLPALDLTLSTIYIAPADRGNSSGSNDGWWHYRAAANQTASPYRAGRVTLLTQATRIATSPPSANGSDLVLAREGDALVAATAVSDEK